MSQGKIQKHHPGGPGHREGPSIEMLIAAATGQLESELNRLKEENDNLKHDIERHIAILSQRDEENASLRSTISDLLKVMEPFDSFSECYPSSEHAGDIVIDWARLDDNSIAQITVGELRALSEAFKRAKGTI